MATVATAAEQRMVLHNISWETYERLLADHENSSAPRFTYDRGELEIMSPLTEHEEYTWAIERLVEVIAEEHGFEIKNLRSSTFRREDLERGFEPDTCFYVANEAAVRAKTRLDLNNDPPPDLVVEVDITRSSLDKLGIFATLGVPEVWRYNGERLTFLVLEGSQYATTSISRALPMLNLDVVLTQLHARREIGQIAWMRRLRAWARTLVG